MEYPHTTGEIEVQADGYAEPLTRREREVAALIARGLTNEQIAQRLVLTPGTVANHVAHILMKFDVQSRVQIAVKMTILDGRSQVEAVLGLLERLRRVRAVDFREALQEATDVLAPAFEADKVDAFLFDASVQTLVALGTSRTPMGKRQHELGLNRLPMGRGGRIAWVFQEGRPFRDGHVEADPAELIDVRRELGVRSTLAVPFQVDPDKRGVVMVSSAQPEHFSDAQLQLLQFVAYWVGLVAREQGTDRSPEGAEE
jgi:DNA-binding CsgD family transcriptional regulator